MIALIYIVFFFFIYFPISFWVILKSYRFTKEKYRHGWVGGFISAFIMYNLVFWDWIPVILIHKHLCETEGGFWVYKTPEQWVKEHPEVVGQDWGDSSNWKHESLNKNYEIDKSYYHEINRFWYASYVYHEIFHPRKNVLGISRTEEKIVDVKSGQILVQSVNFQRGGSFYGGNYKFWLNVGNTSCSDNFYEGVTSELKKLKQLVNGG